MPSFVAVLAARGRIRRTFHLGLVVGVVYFAGTLYWIADVMVAYGGLARPLAVVLNGMLVAFLALFPASAYLAVGIVVSSLGSAGLLLAPALWVASELAREHLFGGFPWVLLGYSQTTVLPIAQIASVAGVYGISGLVAFVNGAVVYGAAGRTRRHWGVAAVAIGAVIAVAVWGTWRMREGTLLTAGTPITVGLVQGNVPQEQKWDPNYRSAILDRYRQLTREVAARGARFVIWPESSTPFYLEDDAAGGTVVRSLAVETGAYLLVGSDQTEPDGRIYNAAFLIRPDGTTGEVYRKIHLVPFGEYLPLENLLFFADPLVEGVGSFTAGEVPVTLPIGSNLASAAICYEVVYPSLIRSFVQSGTELLTTITNDAWYGRSSAPYQHFEQASVRAIEQGRYLARSANTGISGIVDPYGRVLARSGIFTTEALVGEVRFIRARTLYGRMGDVFAYLCTVLGIAGVAAALRTGVPVGGRTRVSTAP